MAQSRRRPWATRIGEAGVAGVATRCFRAMVEFSHRSALVATLAVLLAGPAVAAKIDCSVQSTQGTVFRDGAIIERACQPPRANLNPDVRYFKVTVAATVRDCIAEPHRTFRTLLSSASTPAGKRTLTQMYACARQGADMVYTSLISPDNSSCTGSQGNHICSAPVDNIVTYKAFTGQACLPDEKNNNWADLSPRFSKSITICKPCSPGDYWLGLQLHDKAMACDLKLFAPKLESTAAGASCALTALPTNALVVSTDTCAKGLVREKPVGCPFAHTCLLGTCMNQCHFGYCQDVFFLGAAALAGLILCMLFCCLPVLVLCRRSWRRKLKLAEDHIREMVAKPYQLTVVDDDGMDSDKDEVPDVLPPTFFVRDRDD